MSGLLALVLGVAGAAAVLVALSAPDPFTQTGDARPRTLDELAPVMIGAPFLVGVAIALGILSHALWRDAWRGAAGVGRSIARWAGGTFLLAGVLVGGNWLIERGSVLHVADCATYRFTQSAWRSSSASERVAAADGVARCGIVRERSPARVARLLGAGAQTGSAGLVYDLAAQTPGGERLVLRLDVAGGRVTGGAVEPA
ncbi:hypothetical protein DSM104299_02929 [Baekduia alba]|uniref:hypothetical protein n=1 Tax=Baekduia alba TaxID=2997333 RepID=UPI00234103CC|nr:hypothetical protein [Baekduia alba]WCB94200.1 hypothetical protein DSM104299_02929 [Baekduia alba]